MKSKIQDKISEVEKGCGKLARQGAFKAECGIELLCPTCQAKLLAFKEAQDILAERDKEILEIIDKFMNNLDFNKDGRFEEKGYCETALYKKDFEKLKEKIQNLKGDKNGK